MQSPTHFPSGIYDVQNLKVFLAYLREKSANTVTYEKSSSSSFPMTLQYVKIYDMCAFPCSLKTMLFIYLCLSIYHNKCYGPVSDTAPNNPVKQV